MELKLKMNLLKLLGMGLFAGVLFVVLIFGDNLGVFGTVFILAMLGIFLVGAKDAEILDIKRGRLMLGSIVLLALSFTLHSPKALWLTNVLVIILLCLLYSIHMIDKSEFKVEPMWIVKIFESIVFPIAEIEKPFLLIRDTLKPIKIKKMSSKGKGVIAGVILSLPILAVMIALLASADSVFSQLIRIDLSFFENLGSLGIVQKTVIAIMFGLYVYCYFYYLLHSKNKNADKSYGVEGVSGDVLGTVSGDLSVEKKIKKSSFDKQTKDTIITTILFALNGLFLFFAAIQFSYLFSTGNVSLAGSFTYSEYARRGFFELTLISMMNIGLIAIMISQTKTRFNNILMSILIFNTYIVAASAIYRLNLYIWAYGFTWLRVISQGFIILQAIILAIVLFHVWRRKTNFNVVIVSVYLIGYLVLNYANVDGFIVKGNLDRALKDYDFDGYYHNDLSYDSVDALFDFYINDEIDNASVKKEVLTILRYKHEGLKVESKNWKYFNLAKLNAEKQLSDLFQGNEPNGGIVTEN